MNDAEYRISAWQEVAIFEIDDLAAGFAESLAADLLEGVRSDCDIVRLGVARPGCSWFSVRVDFSRGEQRALMRIRWLLGEIEQLRLPRFRWMALSQWKRRGA